MNRRKRSVTTIETHEVLTIRRRGNVIVPSCPVCVDIAAMLTPQEAAHRAGVSQRTVYRWLEEGRIHFAESGDGELFVCFGLQSSDPG